MRSSNLRHFSILVLSLAMSIGSAWLVAGPIDPAMQFSPTTNPNPLATGTWSYGYENFPLPNAFNLLTLPGSIGPLDYWRSPSFGDVGVYDNPSTFPVPYNTLSDSATYQPGEIGMHPGPNDQYGVVQFTAPANGQYDIHGTFEGLDSTGLTDTFVDLLWNNVPMVSGTVIGDGSGSDVPLSFGPVILNAGDTLAFAVGGAPDYGSTGLLPGAAVDAVSTPEPSSLLLLGVAVASFAVYRLRRRFV